MQRYLLYILIEQMPGLEALELQNSIMVSMMPHIKDSDRRKTLRDLRRRIQDRIAPPSSRPRVIIEHNPEEARKWFESRGIAVGNAGNG